MDSNVKTKISLYNHTLQNLLDDLFVAVSDLEFRNKQLEESNKTLKKQLRKYTVVEDASKNQRNNAEVVEKKRNGNGKNV